MKKSALFILSLLSVGSINLFAQQRYSGNEMDFWIGEWNLTWTTQDGKPGKGVNIVEKILDDAVILENFEAQEGSYKGFSGKSFSVYNKQSDAWFQTWVDSQYGYLPFTFEMDGEKRIFKRQSINASGKNIWSRMVFYDIDTAGFTWDWQQSEDGNSWLTIWQIIYRRK